MELSELIESGGHIVLPVTVTDLQQFGHFLIELAKQELEATIAEGKSEVYYTPEQVKQLPVLFKFSVG